MHIEHNQVIAKSNLFKLFQEKNQSPKDFCDQFIAMPFASSVGIEISHTDKGSRAILQIERP